MQKVVMVRPNWDKGYIDKFLVCDLGLKRVMDIYPVDSEHLSHIQYAAIGNHLIRIRHCLKTNTLSEDVYLVSSPTPIIVKKAKYGEAVQKQVEVLRNKEHKLFSILGGLNEMTKVEFDCPQKLVKRFLTPVKTVDEEMYDFICSQLKYSRREDCPTTWGASAKLPKYLNVRERLSVNADGTTANHVSEHWLLIYADGRTEMPELAPTKGARIDANSQRTLEIFTAAPKPMPEDVVQAMKITIGVNEIEGDLCGISINLYK